MSRNRLKDSTSPYLLQHAENPVDWWPWCEEALALARETNKPVLLSIGYSACHWCHVMAHESFEDQATADLMNKHYINIKVDREERPDLDKIYQTAHQLMVNRPGGWPLTMFLTPDNQTPFFGGTYFPGEQKYGMPAFKDLLQQISDAFVTQQEDIDKQNQSMREALASLNPAPAGDVRVDDTPLDAARQELENSFDAHYGGFGQAPKFPHPTNIERLLRHWHLTRTHGNEDQRALHMAVYTLEKMALGGVNDLVGGGFCRYSVDEKWMIPHFEKMLYDNGPLLQLYAEAWQATRNPLFKRTAIATAEWVMREMQAESGGYFSSLDADSEGVEGRFYVWTPAEVEQPVGEEIYPMFARLYGLDRAANFEEHWHLHTYEPVDEVCIDFGLTAQQALQRLDIAFMELLKRREQRIKPGRDEKILTSWNALMIKGMVHAGLVFKRDDFIDSACSAFSFICANMLDDGRLLATHKDGVSHLNAYLDDYAYLLDATLELLSVRWNNDWLTVAIQLADTLLEQFEDSEGGGFFFTSHDHEQLIQRPRPMGDDSMPSGNGIAARALNRLGHLVGEQRYILAAENTVKASWSAMTQLAWAHCAMLNAAEEQIYPLETVVVRASTDKLASLRAEFSQNYRPGLLMIGIPDNVTGLPGKLGQQQATGDFSAFYCSGAQCLAPVHDESELITALANHR